MRPSDMFVMDFATRGYLRRPPVCFLLCQCLLFFKSLSLLLCFGGRSIDGLIRQVLKPSACTPLFLAAFTLRNAGCCIHTHSQWAVLVTLLCERRDGEKNVFSISTLEQIKGVPRGYGEDRKGNLGYYDTLRIPIIENTPHEEDLKDTLEGAIEAWPDTYAVLVRRHGM